MVSMRRRGARRRYPLHAVKHALLRRAKPHQRGPCAPGDPASTAQNLHPTQHGPGSALYLVNLRRWGHTPITATALRYTLSRSLASAPRSNISHA